MKSWWCCEGMSPSLVAIPLSSTLSLAVIQGELEERQSLVPFSVLPGNMVVLPRAISIALTCGFWLSKYCLGPWSCGRRKYGSSTGRRHIVCLVQQLFMPQSWNLSVDGFVFLFLDTRLENGQRSGLLDLDKMDVLWTAFFWFLNKGCGLSWCTRTTRSSNRPTRQVSDLRTASQQRL